MGFYGYFMGNHGKSWVSYNGLVIIMEILVQLLWVSPYFHGDFMGNHGKSWVRVIKSP